MSTPTLFFVPCFSGAPWDLPQLAPLRGRPLRTMRLPDGLDTVEAYADALADEVSTLKDYVLVGDSFGAIIALAFATRQPSGLRGLVLSGGFAANPVSSPGWNAAARLMGTLRGSAYRQVVLRVHARRLASPHDAEGEVPWDERKSRRLFLEHTPAAAFGARVRAVLDADYTDALRLISAPTLIVTPSHDALVGAHAARVLREGVPRARELVLARTGHMLRFSHPHAYARAVADFLRDEGL